MKSKLLPLLILSLALLGPTNLNAQETPQPTDSLTQYGLEQGKSYSAEVVAQLLDAAVAEGRSGVVRAWNDGYKAGAADYAPSGAYFESLSAAWSAEAKRTGPTWGTVALAGAGGLAAGFGAGVVVTAIIIAVIK